MLVEELEPIVSLVSGYEMGNLMIYKIIFIEEEEAPLPFWGGGGCCQGRPAKREKDKFFARRGRRRHVSDKIAAAGV